MGDLLLDREVISLLQSMIGKDWKQLGRELGVPEYTLDSIRIDHCGYGVQEMAIQMLKEWQHQIPESCNVEHLIQCLKRIKRADIVNKLNEALKVKEMEDISNQKESVRQALSSGHLLEKIEANLKQKYSVLQMKGLPWMKNVNLCIADYFVSLGLNLSLNTAETKQIGLHQIFQETKRRKKRKSKSLRILMEGAMGYGKTILCSKLCYDWARNEKYIGFYDVVLFFPLRRFKSTLVEMLFSALHMDGNEFAQNLLQNVMTDDSKQILLILDGLDELAVNQRDSILDEICSGLFRNVSVIVTSRPGTFTTLQSKDENEYWHNTGVGIDTTKLLYDNKITILGISREMQEEFTNIHLSSYSKKRRDLALKQLANMRNNKFFTPEFLRCPLFLLMVLLMITNETALQAVQTKTCLYKYLFNFVMRRYWAINKTPHNDQHIDLFDFEGYPFYVQLLDQFGQLSIDILRSGRIYFTLEERPVLMRHPEFTEIGLLVRVNSASCLGGRETYEPIHLSLMEFAAAYALSAALTRSSSCQWEHQFAKLLDLRPNFNSALTSYLFPFLVGLMGDNAALLFDALHIYRAEYTEWFGSLSNSLMETRLALVDSQKMEIDFFQNPLLKSLIPLLPETWVIPWGSENQCFSESVLHKVLIQFGIQVGQIKTVKWKVGHKANLPDEIHVDTIILQFAQSLTSVEEPEYSTFRCHELSVDIQSPVMNLTGFQDIIQNIKFKRMSVNFMYSFATLTMSYIDSHASKEDLNCNLLNLVRFHFRYSRRFLVSTITSLIKENVLDTIKLISPHQESELYLSLFAFIFLFLYCTPAFTSCLPVLSFIFLFCIASRYLEQPLDMVVAHILNLLMHKLTLRKFSTFFDICIQYIDHVTTITLFILGMVASLTPSVSFNILYSFIFCLISCGYLPRYSHLGIVVRAAIFCVLKPFCVNMLCSGNSVCVCLVVYGLYSFHSSYHLYDQLRTVWYPGAVASYLCVSICFHFLLPFPLLIYSFIVLYLIPCACVIAFYPRFFNQLLSHFRFHLVRDDSMLYNYCNKSLLKNDPVHSFFKCVFTSTVFSFIFYLVLEILCIYSNCSLIRSIMRIIFPLLPLVPTILPSLVLPWLCSAVGCLLLSQQQFDEFVVSAGVSRPLTRIILGNRHKLGRFPRPVVLFKLELSQLCDRGLKSWEWVQLEGIEIVCNKHLFREFKIQHLDLSLGLISQDTCDYFLGFCQVTSFVCSASFLKANSNFWQYQGESLTELYVLLDGTSYNFLFTTVQLKHIKVLGVTVTKLPKTSRDLKQSSSILDFCTSLNPKGFELWNVENNFLLSLEIVKTLFAFKQNACVSSTYKSRHSRNLCLDYLLLHTDIKHENSSVEKYSSHSVSETSSLIKLASQLKKPLKERLLGRLYLICQPEVTHEMSLHKSNDMTGSWVDVFPPREFFNVTHDLWGKQKEDTVRSKGMSRLYPDKYHRWSASLKQ